MNQVFNLRVALVMFFGTLIIGLVMIFALNPVVSTEPPVVFNPPAFATTSLPPRAVMTMTALGYDLTRTQNAIREQTLGVTLTPSPTVPTATFNPISPVLQTATAIIQQATALQQTTVFSMTQQAIVSTEAAQRTATEQAQATNAAITQTQAVQNATEGTLSLIVSPEATPTP